jgi:hypothetical protein
MKDIKRKKNLKAQYFHRGLHIILKEKIERKKLMKKKKKKYESTRLTRQTMLTCQTYDPCHESLIIK